jgi:hypothetical protein
MELLPVEFKYQAFSGSALSFSLPPPVPMTDVVFACGDIRVKGRCGWGVGNGSFSRGWELELEVRLVALHAN